jgi:hypothetical protein
MNDSDFLFDEEFMNVFQRTQLSVVNLDTLGMLSEIPARVKHQFLPNIEKTSLTGNADTK